MAGDLVTDQSYDFLKELFRDFGAQQDAMEPNVYVVAMSKLRRAKSNNPQSKLFASYIVTRALKRRREQTRQDVIRSVDKSNLVCQLPDAPASKKKQLEGLGDWLGKLCRSIRARSSAEIVSGIRRSSDWSAAKCFPKWARERFA